MTQFNKPVTKTKFIYSSTNQAPDAGDDNAGISAVPPDTEQHNEEQAAAAGNNTEQQDR